jgi:hypothetical protein
MGLNVSVDDKCVLSLHPPFWAVAIPAQPKNSCPRRPATCEQAAAGTEPMPAMPAPAELTPTARAGAPAVAGTADAPLGGENLKYEGFRESDRTLTARSWMAQAPLARLAPQAPTAPVDPAHRWPAGANMVFEYAGAKLVGKILERSGFRVTGRTSAPRSWIRTATHKTNISDWAPGPPSWSAPPKTQWSRALSCLVAADARGLHFEPGCLVSTFTDAPCRVGDKASADLQHDTPDLAQVLADRLSGVATWRWSPPITVFVVEGCEPRYRVESKGETYLVLESSIAPLE